MVLGDAPRVHCQLARNGLLHPGAHQRCLGVVLEVDSQFLMYLAPQCECWRTAHGHQRPYCEVAESGRSMALSTHSRLSSFMEADVPDVTKGSGMCGR